MERFMVYGLWFMVYGLWFMVYGENIELYLNIGFKLIFRFTRKL